MSEPRKTSLWTGRVFSFLAVLPFLPSAVMKLIGTDEVIKGFEHFGWSSSSLFTIGVLEILCAVLYLIPSFSMLGAVMLTGFLGGAIATHMRIGEPVYIHLVIGVLIWGGLFLREPRLRLLLPVRGKDFFYKREISVACSSQVAFDYLKNLNNFKDWNPFLKKDPQASVQLSGSEGQPGSVLAWSGNNQVGSGEQEIIKINENNFIEFEIRFKTPFTATNIGRWTVEADLDKQTKITWSMQGATIFPMTIFSLFINLEKMICKDFESGLSDLKRILEK